jgi:NhaP-type Na+/H+ or K+/H+ antiporter
MIPRQRVQRKPSKGADKIVLGMFALRLGIGLIAFATIATLAFQLPEKHFAWMVLLIGVAYLSVAGTILVKALRKYRARYGEDKR